ncbi:PaaI family thioesterase [Tistrella mobilis]|uniref:PaaI family thioesterase n=1 Tax=Tistrella mobilis TaxID=171437 RepID=UPI0031F64A62
MTVMVEPGLDRIRPDAFNQIIRDELPMAELLGIRVERIDDGVARGRLPATVQLIRPGGTLSGPALATLADVTFYAAIMGRLGPARMAVTSNLNINFLRRPAMVDVLSEARLIRCGRRLVYGEVSLYSDGDDEPVAHTTLTFALPG